MKTGQVYGISDGAYVVKSRDEFYACKRRGKITHNKIKILVGDIVAFDETNLAIEEVLPRKNELIRPNVANIDQLLICVSIEPPPDLLVVDKLLILAQQNNINPIIVVTKADLDVASLERQIKQNYARLGVEIITVSTKGRLPDAIKNVLENKLTAVAGQSGVGKSSLLNFVSERLNIKTDALGKNKRGKNTTTVSRIYDIGSARILDTPGFSVIDIATKEPNEFLTLYPDIHAFSSGCRYKTCNHLNKVASECGVVRALEEGRINKERFARFIRQYQLLTGMAQKYHKIHKKEEKK